MPFHSKYDWANSLKNLRTGVNLLKTQQNTIIILFEKEMIFFKLQHSLFQQSIFDKRSTPGNTFQWKSGFLQ